MARGFGAPHSVPAGKHAASTSYAVRPGAASDDRRHDVHDVAVALDAHEVDDLDGPPVAHATEVVAPEVDEHQVLGALLLVGEQLLGERVVLLGRRPAPARAGDRVQQRPAVIDLDQRLGDEPTTSKPSKRNRYMYGLGLVRRSTR